VQPLQQPATDIVASSMSTRREISAQLDLGAIFKLAQVARVRCSPGLTLLRSSACSPSRSRHHLPVTLMMATHPFRRWRHHRESDRTLSLRPPPGLRSAASFLGPMAQILREAVPQNHTWHVADEQRRSTRNARRESPRRREVPRAHLAG
jgi:hypothetical protein